MGIDEGQRVEEVRQLLEEGVFLSPGGAVVALQCAFSEKQYLDGDPAVDYWDPNSAELYDTGDKYLGVCLYNLGVDGSVKLQLFDSAGSILTTENVRRSRTFVDYVPDEQGFDIEGELEVVISEDTSSYVVGGVATTTNTRGADAIHPGWQIFVDYSAGETPLSYSVETAEGVFEGVFYLLLDDEEG